MAGLYRGMAFPFGPTLADYFDAKSDRDILRTSIETILLTRFGERVMLPGFGSPLREAVFEPDDDLLEDKLIDIVRENVPFWDRRLEVLDVSVAQQSDHYLSVNVIYRDLGIPDSQDSFIFNIPSDIVSRID